MKRTKIMLAAIVVLAGVGSALAFKVNSKKVFCTDTAVVGSNKCTDASGAITYKFATTAVGITTDTWTLGQYCTTDPAESCPATTDVYHLPGDVD